MVEFHFLDWFWIVAYTLLTVALGAVFYRLGRRSSEDFFVAGRGPPVVAPLLERLRHAHGHRPHVRPSRAL